MKTTILRRLIAIVCLLSSLQSFAAVGTDYDFKVDGICYEIISSKNRTVAVIYNDCCFEYTSTGRFISDFNYNTKYTGSVVIPESVTCNSSSYSVVRIGSDAFSGCSGLTSVTIPNSVTSIGSEAFSGCTGLTTITIPNSVTSIGFDAFSGCTGLTTITIPNSVTSIGQGVFSNCSGLATIIVESGNTTYDSRDNCNAIIETSTNKLIAGCANTVIPNSVTSIAYDAFSGCTGLTTITIPNSVTSIGQGVFSGCI